MAAMFIITLVCLKNDCTTFIHRKYLTKQFKRLAFFWTPALGEGVLGVDEELSYHKLWRESVLLSLTVERELDLSNKSHIRLLIRISVDLSYAAAIHMGSYMF